MKTLTLLLLILTAALPVLADDESTDAKKKGGAFLIMTQYTRMDMAPVADLARKEATLKQYTFNLDNNNFLLQGFGAYWGRKNDVRAGFGLWGGYRRFESNPYTGILRDAAGNPLVAGGDTLTNDSTAELMVIPAYLGFLIEKSRSFGQFNVYAGGLIGAGVNVVIKDIQERETRSAFHNAAAVDSMGPAAMGEDAEVAAALLWTFDAHAGCTYSLASWFHLGLEGSLTAMYSGEGYGCLSESFSMINPGIRLRLVLGNLG